MLGLEILIILSGFLFINASLADEYTENQRNNTSSIEAMETLIITLESQTCCLMANGEAISTISDLQKNFRLAHSRN